MKRVRCPKCDSYTIFDETNYIDGQALVFVCENCSKEFKIKLGVSKLHNKQNEETNPQETSSEVSVGTLLVIESQFNYKHELPLRMGDNIIGRYQKGHNIQCPIESNDPSLDMHHCVLTVRHNKRGGLKYVLRDGPSFVGTFVDGDILADREQRVIDNGTLFTLGATSIILKTTAEND